MLRKYVVELTENSVGTIRDHLRNIYRKLDIDGKPELIRLLGKD